MASAAMTEADYADVQGLVRFGYGKMTRASYALVRVKHASAARTWLRSAPVTNAVATDPPPKTALNVAFTAPGLQALGVADSIIATFSHEFRGGMAQESRSRQLGDVGKNAPSNWKWGNSGQEPHAVIMFFGEPESFDSFVRSSTSSSWAEGFGEPHWLETENLDGVEPFGFTDGISQPQIDWQRRRDVTRPQLDYGNIVALGEFLLGYPNEYNKYTDRPLVDLDSSNSGLFAAEDYPEKKDLGRNGTYLVVRQLRQDVRAFWCFVYQQAGGNFGAADELASAFVGRRRSGDPLMPIAYKTIPGIGSDPKQVRQNQFTFAQDPVGARCPFGAHVRRANPRNSDYPGRPTGIAKLITMLGFGPKGFHDDLISPVRFHRILRRGREYGPGLSPEDALTPEPPNDPERGLHFVCLNANILRQFEFLQNAWIASTKFSGMTEESDPLLGNREKIPGCQATADFTKPTERGLRHRVFGLPQFVTVRGGAYFFLPSLRVLRYFAGFTGTAIART
jgi:deferrochelatase/peroxidase EfeB